MGAALNPEGNENAEQNGSFIAAVAAGTGDPGPGEESAAIKLYYPGDIDCFPYNRAAATNTSSERKNVTVTLETQHLYLHLECPDPKYNVEHKNPLSIASPFLKPNLLFSQKLPPQPQQNPNSKTKGRKRCATKSSSSTTAAASNPPPPNPAFIPSPPPSATAATCSRKLPASSMLIVPLAHARTQLRLVRRRGPETEAEGAEETKAQEQK
ncbi:hypothetical protein MMC22_002976 [Lobaria immixta]|nr:hypothetical protein [Lobaria immixta]